MTTSYSGDLLSSQDIEKKALVSSIADIKNLYALVQNLRVTDFTYIYHQEMFLLLCEIYKETENIGLSTVCQKAKDKGVLEKLGGLQELQLFLTSYARSCEMNSYIEILKEKTARRDAFNLRSMFNDIEKIDRPISQFIEEIREKLYNIESRSSSVEMTTAQNLLRTGFDGKSYLDELDKIQNARNCGSYLSGVSTGFKDIDNILGGLQNGNFILLAARPGMGKTTLALNIWEHVTIEEKLPSLFIALEMKNEDIIYKLISSHCKVDYKSVMEKTLSGLQYQAIVPFINDYTNKYENYLTNKQNFSLGKIRTTATRAKDAFGIRVLFIDYLQLIAGSAKYDNKYAQITEISIGLKNLAMDLNIPIVCLSQLSRKVEERVDKTPQLSDLRDSGSLEADADIVLFLHRWDQIDPAKNPGMSRVIVAKNRRGNTGEITLKHSLNISRFDSTTYIAGK